MRSSRGLAALVLVCLSSSAWAQEPAPPPDVALTQQQLEAERASRKAVEERLAESERTRAAAEQEAAALKQELTALKQTAVTLTPEELEARQVKAFADLFTSAVSSPAGKGCQKAGGKKDLLVLVMNGAATAGCWVPLK